MQGAIVAIPECVFRASGQLISVSQHALCCIAQIWSPAQDQHFDLQRKLDNLIYSANFDLQRKVGQDLLTWSTEQDLLIWSTTQDRQFDLQRKYWSTAQDHFDL